MSDITSAQSGIPKNWIEKLKGNDEQVLKAIYLANYARIERYVLNNSGTEADAKDIYQEAFITVWRNIQMDKVSFESLDKLQGYIFRIAQYKWLDQLRMNKRQKTSLADIMKAEDTDVEYIEKEEEDYLQRVKAGYASLGEPCKNLLHRFYFLKQSMSEIAAIFSWTEATAKNNKYRCLQRLRNKVLPEKAKP